LNCRTQLWDFAFAGADVSSVYTAPHHNFTIPFVDQITQWSTYAKPVLKVDFAKALVAVWIGINDINDSSRFKFPVLNATDFPSLYKEIISTEFAALEAVYAAGYRNFLFMNLPPLDRTPGAIAAGPAAALPNTTMVHTWNNLIGSFAADFSVTHPGSEVMVFDTYTYLNGILDNHLQYGFSNITGFCLRYDAPDIVSLKREARRVSSNEI
jgi:phospholipase/lecithinase/hemolysin